jgi:two-component system response regulator AtoC
VLNAAALHERVDDEEPMILEKSEGMAGVRQAIDRVADTDVTVLIRGERGTGKELVARALHASSSRRDKLFIKVNCAGPPDGVLESELFGFERSAFPGALNAKPGKFEFANHGTLFLDGVDEISPALHAKLLPVLQHGKFSRVGGTRDVRVDVRVVAATDRELDTLIAGIVISVPPLRERRQEIPILTDHFVRKYSVQYDRPHTAISPDTMRLFMEYDWPGNVRELENVIKRAVVLGSDAAIRRDVMRQARPAWRRAQPGPAAERTLVQLA